MIFLDHHFTIPNFPSRLLAYMQAGVPVLACTDQNTDIGKVIVEGGFGWWCESNHVSKFNKIVQQILTQDLKRLKQNAFEQLAKHYDVKESCQTILKKMEHT